MSGISTARGADERANHIKSVIICEPGANCTAFCLSGPQTRPFIVTPDSLPWKVLFSSKLFCDALHRASPELPLGRAVDLQADGALGGMYRVVPQWSQFGQSAATVWPTRRCALPLRYGETL